MPVLSPSALTVDETNSRAQASVTDDSARPSIPLVLRTVELLVAGGAGEHTCDHVTK